MMGAPRWLAWAVVTAGMTASGLASARRAPPVTTWIYRDYQHSLESASTEPLVVLTYTLTLADDGTAGLSTDLQRGTDTAPIQWGAHNAHRYTGHWGKGKGGTAILVTDSAGNSLAFACRPGTAHVAGATARRTIAPGESGAGAWSPAATTVVPTLDCTRADPAVELTFGAGAGIEQLAMSTRGVGLRVIAPDHAIAPAI